MLSGSWSSDGNSIAAPSPRSSASRVARARRSRSSSSSWSTTASSAAARPRRSTTAASRSSPRPSSSPPPRPPLVGDDPFALEAIEERLEDVDGEAAGKAALDAALHDWIGKRLGVPLWRLLGLSPEAPAHLVHDRDRLARRHARPRAASARVPRPQDQGRRRRGPRAPGGGARGVGRAAAGGRQRGLDARVRARADARADPARRRVRRAALPGRRPGLVPRPARAAAHACRSSSTRAARTCATWHRRPPTPTGST